MSVRKIEEEDSGTLDKFSVDDAVESAWINPVIELAKKQGRVILNNGDISDLDKAINTTLEEILPD